MTDRPTTCPESSRPVCANRADFLDPETELRLIRRWQGQRDEQAADRLIRRYQPLVTGLARRYRGLGVLFDDLVAEGNTGLLRAMDRFDAAHGARLSTYATWWIRAAVADAVLNGPIVRIVVSEQGRKLFFNLRRLKAKLGATESGDLAPDVVTAIAAEVDVSEDEVIRVNRRLAARDLSLNAPVAGRDGSPVEWQDVMADPAADLEDQVAERDQFSKRMAVLEQAMAGLNGREQQILCQRWLSDEPRSLADIGAELGITRERVRQIENAALKKLQSRVRGDALGATLSGDAAPKSVKSSARPRARPMPGRTIRPAKPVAQGGTDGLAGL
ncbi:MAG: sigma-70 family RNA polymerase sigma factor [Rhodospirillales bacterium]|nr:MAG: sigma-70 family RNA polymerase sigma factor [Rhodospirillales bacterium]